MLNTSPGDDQSTFSRPEKSGRRRMSTIIQITAAYTASASATSSDSPKVRNARTSVKRVSSPVDSSDTRGEEPGLADKAPRWCELPARPIPREVVERMSRPSRAPSGGSARAPLVCDEPETRRSARLAARRSTSAGPVDLDRAVHVLSDARGELPRAVPQAGQAPDGEEIGAGALLVRRRGSAFILLQLAAMTRASERRLGVCPSRSPTSRRSSACRTTSTSSAS